jgi:hypothetical protein
LGGTFASTSVERQRLATVTRLWVASWSPTPSSLPPQLGFTLTYKLHTRGVWLRLYTRPRAAATGQTTAAAARAVFTRLPRAKRAAARTAESNETGPA